MQHGFEIPFCPALSLSDSQHWMRVFKASAILPDPVHSILSRKKPPCTIPMRRMNPKYAMLMSLRIATKVRSEVENVVRFQRLS